MIDEILHQCVDCEGGLSEYEDNHYEEDDMHFCDDCAKDAGLYKCHYCARVYDIKKNNNTCPECGRRPE